MIMADAVVLTSAILAAGGAVIAGIIKLRPRETNGFVTKIQCDDRFKFVCSGVARIEHTQEEIFRELKELRSEIGR